MDLYLEPIRLKYNPLNGQFLKGIIPHNKGLKAINYMSIETLNKMKLTLKRTGNHYLGGRNKKKVIGIERGKFIGCFESATFAANKFNLERRNISSCCEGKRKLCGGINWFFESEYYTWKNYLNENM